MSSYKLSEAISVLRSAVVKYEVLVSICGTFFQYKRQVASHGIYFDPYCGEFINIQSNKGDAKMYQQRQVAALLQRRIDGGEA